MSTPQPTIRQEILGLALPAFLTLIAEPLFLLVDSAIVGNLGVTELAALGVAGAALATAAAVFVFLAYATTSVVARAIGAGDRRRAASAGVDGMWLALLLGAGVTVLVVGLAEPICWLLGARGDVLTGAAGYLRVAGLGLPGMLVALAVTGVLRGFQDTRTPLFVSVAGFSVNAALSYVFVWIIGVGLTGAALGTLIAQAGMGIAYGVALVRLASHEGAGLGFHPTGVKAAMRGGAPLIVRTVALRAILLLTVWVAAGLGAVPMAAHQVAYNVWSLLAMALDALAIAAQALVGKELGAGDLPGVRERMALMIRWGVWLGVALGAATALLSPLLPALFTSDDAVRHALTGALVVVGLSQPLAGVVFVLDGVLIGAGDGKWLAKAMAITFVAYLPLVLSVRAAGPWLLAHGTTAATIAIWLAFTGFMLVRGLLLAHRARGDDWMVAGIAR